MGTPSFTTEKYYNVQAKIQRYNDLVTSSRDIDEKIKIMKDLYSYIKKESIYFYKGGYMDCGYKNLMDLIIDCENNLPKIFLLNVEPTYVSDSFDISSISHKNAELILDIIVKKVRNILCQLVNFGKAIIYPIQNCDLTNFCEISSNIVLNFCKHFNIECEIKIIEPAFVKNSRLLENSGFHYFNIVTINDRKYLVDCTYSQFFLLERNFLERIGVPMLSGCNVGTFMLMERKRKKVAEKILADGWVLLDKGVMKTYLDGFAIKYRNGLYYEDTQDFTYRTNYTDEDYENFLNGNDNQTNHEKILYLGYQKQPLQNPNLAFDRKKPKRFR